MAKTFATGGYHGSLTIWDTATGQPRIRNFDDIGPVTTLAYSLDGQFIITGSAIRNPETSPLDPQPLRQPLIQLWNATTGEVVRTFESQRSDE